MKYSITIPAYKSKYLEEAITSILSQTYHDFELIIVNDASPEDLDSIINKFNDSRIHYYKNERNCGAINVVDNWNICLSYVKGDYVICMGDDDKLLPNCLEIYDKLIKKYPGLGVYHGLTEIIDENSQFYNVTASRCEYESVYSYIWHRWDNRNQQYIGDFLFDTSLLRKNGGFYKNKLAWGSDDISAAIAAIPHGIANTSEVIFQYRINSQTISSTGNSLIKMEAIQNEQMWYKSFLDVKPKNLQDIKFHQLLISTFNKRFIKKKVLSIACDLDKHSFLRIFFWFRNKNRYDISGSIILYAYLESLKRKRTRKM